MKKFFAVVFVSALILSLCGCTNNDYFEYVSQLRTDLFIGAADDIEIKAYAERREQPLKNDGYANELHDFVIIKLTFLQPQNSVITDLSVDFCIFDEQYAASLAFNAQADSYVATVPVKKLPTEDFTVTVKLGSSAKNVILNKVKTNMLSPEKALKIVVDKKSELIKKLEDSKSPFEFMIRLIAEGNSFFYYVGIVETEYTTALLVSADGKILAEKRLKNQ